MVSTYGELYAGTRKAFMTQEDPQMASWMARTLVCHITGKTQEQLLSHRDMYASEQMCADVEAAVPRLLAGEPLPYVLGEWDFYGMTLCVD